MLFRSPEHIELGDGGLPMVVNLTEQLGGNTVLYGSYGNDQTFVVQIVGQAQFKRGDTVQVIFPPDKCHVFDRDGRSLRS